MRAGSLDRRIVIEEKVETQSSSGHPVESWRVVSPIWAGIRYDRGSERFNAPQYVGRSVVTFRVRWSSITKGITVEHRISYEDRQYDILDIRELGRREGIEIDASVRSEKSLIGTDA